MTISRATASSLDLEAASLLTRLDRVQPFSLIMPRVAGAAIDPAAERRIHDHLVHGRAQLRQLVAIYRNWLRGSKGRASTPDEAQRRLAFLRLKFNAVLTQFDIFADALTQRGEHQNGVWLAGLDVAASDALELSGGYLRPPPLMTYLDRGHGAAIRRARTRLPGGGTNPVAIVRIPRERMVGSGIASSLFHEVGHQGAALLGLVDSLREGLKTLQQSEGGSKGSAWELWGRWISEIIADFWSIATIGVGATQGLMGVVSLPRAFVFRINLDDPHPFPWIRVKLSAATGQLLFPDPQWSRLASLWESLYPQESLPEKPKRVVAELEASLPSFVRFLANHRPRSLRGRSLASVFALRERQPERLRSLYTRWQASPKIVEAERPGLLLAVLGQARHDRKLHPREESRMVSRLLQRWALARALGGAPARNLRSQPQAVAA